MKQSLKTIALFIAFITGLSAFAQPQLIEKVTARPDGMVIPYEKWKMPNGLTVILHEDHSDPIVHVQVTYNVGSSRESIGKSGFAHFFEHMMFQGSDHVKDEEHFKIVSEAGGDMNGFTQRDATVYYETLPSNQLEVALWLEADRMGFLLDSLTSKKFENQRDAVKNEKGQNYENRPYGMVVELLYQTLYPYKHPYSWLPIGYTDDLNRATLQDVKNFFLRWYGPNNAILTISGDVNPQEALKLTEKYFGNIKPCPEVKKMKLPAVVLPADKYASYKDNIYLPLNYRVYPTIPRYHRDEPALDMLASMMGQGNNSIFYKNFVKSKLAIDASVSHGTEELSGEFGIQVVAYPPEDYNFQKFFNEIDGKVKATVEEFEKTGITDEALQRAKAKMESQIISGGEGVFGKSMLLSEWHRLLGKTYNLSDELERYNKVTKDDVARVLNKYIKGAGAAVIDVYPKMMSKDSVKSFNPYASIADNYVDPEYANLKYVKPVDNFDRAAHPKPGAPKAPIVPDYYTSELKNGLKIYGTRETESPKVIIYIQMEGGDLLLKPEEAKKMGIATLTSYMMNEATQNYTTEQISAELEKLGSDITINAGKENTTITVECLKKNLDATLKLLEEKLFRPKFDAEDFKRVKKQYKEALKDEKTSPQAVASKAYQNVLYGNTPFGTFATVKTVDKLELEDVKDYYNKYYSPNVTTLSIVGDITDKEILPKLSFLEKWQPKEVVIKPAMPAQQTTEQQVFIVDRPGAPQSIIMMGNPSLSFDATGDYFKNTVVNYPYGGAFNSRLNLNLREDKGYTYGIRSYFAGGPYNGNFTISTSVKRAATGNSLAEIMKETQGYITNGVTDAELAFTKNSLLNSEVLEYESAFQKALFLTKIARYRLSKDFTVQQSNILKSMTKDDFNAQIKKYIMPDKMSVVIVGDKEIIKRQLDKMAEANKQVKLGKVKELNFD